MRNLLITTLSKNISLFIKLLGLGKGSTWPGHIALKLNKNYINETVGTTSTKKVLISGTNGKTTTGKLISEILKKNGFSVVHNECGANLLSGIASSIILSNIKNPDYAIFEIDENVLPSAIQSINPDFIILLNLFRDQLDRYGEINTIAKKWKEALRNTDLKTKIIFNADDPLVSSLAKDLKTKNYFFGLKDIKNEDQSAQAADSIFCPDCGEKLNFTKRFFSHLGIWNCSKCKLRRQVINFIEIENYPLPGIYNMYNTQAALVFASLNNITKDKSLVSLKNFKPAFGRQEEININGKKIIIFLSKNPTSLNESLRTVKSLGGTNIFLILNNRIPDGKDISWIWDVSFENLLSKEQTITVSGDRAYDLAIRLKYSQGLKNVKVFEDFKNGVQSVLNSNSNETIYFLPTYSAMLDLRKELTGKNI
jgi:lipid II isoglutaminyl synthase (glutamine-hydrolysing)